MSDKQGPTVINHNEAKIGVANGNITINSYSSQEKFKDPTVAFSQSPVDMELDAIIPDSDLEKYIELLKKNRIIAISSQIEDIADRTSQKLAFDPYFDSYEKRSLFFEGENIERGIILWTFLDKKIESKKPYLIVIHVSDKNFLESMFLRDNIVASAITNHLKGNDLYLITLIYDSEILSYLSEIDKNFLFPYWEIKHLKLLLESCFDALSTIKYLEKIQKLRSRWGSTELQIFEYIKNLLIENPELLLDEIDNEKNNTPEKPTIEEIIDNNETIKHVCFIATYFPNLTVKKFHNLVGKFLKEDAKKVFKVEQERVIEYDDKEAEIAKETIDKTCYEIWNYDPDEIIRKAKLEYKQDKNHQKVIDFENINLRSEFKKYFERKAIYSLNQFDFLFNDLNLFFDLYTSDSVVINLIKFSVEMAKDDPDSFRFTKPVTSTAQIEKHGDLSPFEKALFFFETNEFKENNTLYLQRIAKLLDELMQVKGLEISINRFWNLLFQNEELREVAFILVHYLKHSPKFDKFYWLKQLIDRSKENRKDKVYLQLIKIADKLTSPEVYPMLDDIASWHPEPDKENLSPSNYMGLSFILHYSIETIRKIELENYGQWLSKYPLFAPLSSEDKEFNVQKIEFLIGWLLNDKLADAYRNVSDSTDNEDFNYIISYILEQWLHILYGIDNGSMPIAEDTGDRILVEITKKLSAKEKLILRNNWGARSQFYLNEMSKLGLRQSAERQILIKRRKTTQLIIKKFGKLSKA